MRLNYSRQGCTGISYDGVNLSDAFTIEDVSIALLPTFEAVTQELAQRPGAYFSSRKVGTREVKVRLRLDAESRSPVDIFKAWREFSDVFNKPDPRPLMLNEDKYVNALVIGDTEIENSAYYGTVEIAFMCFDPFFYGDEHVISLPTGTTPFSVFGGVSAYPCIEATANSGTVTVTNAVTAEYVRISGLAMGSRIVIDMERQTATIGGEYVPVDLLSDFFTIDGEARITLSGATGTLTYRERYL